VYLPEHLDSAIATLTQAAIERGADLGPDVPVWCHGYETGAAAQALKTAGHRVVGVAHYLVGVETLHDLALGDDPVRRAAFDSPWATAIGRLTPRALRPMGVRWASRVGDLGRRMPLPAAVRTQFAKLDLERRLMAHADTIIAVGPSFEGEMNDLYPCTVERSAHTIAGAPTTLPDPTWPFDQSDDRLRIAMVGRPTGQKGWDYAAAALAQLSPEDAARIDLVIIGGLGQWEGPFSAYSSRVAADFEALSHLRMANLGPLPHTSVLAHLQAADVLLFPSVFEPLGLVLLEAMAAGCMVLASDAAGPRDLLHAPWGITVAFDEPGSRVDSLLAGIQTLLALSRTEIIARQDASRAAARGADWAITARAHRDALFPGLGSPAHG